MFRSQASLEARQAAYDLAPRLPRAVAISVGTFAAEGSSFVLLDAIERFLDFLLAVELMQSPGDVQATVLSACETPPLMWGRKLKMIEQRLVARHPLALDLWNRESVWEEVRNELGHLPGWFTRGTAPCLFALWPLVQLRNDLVHRRETHAFEPFVLLNAIRALGEASKYYRMVCIERLEPVDTGFEVAFLDYNIGTGFPAPRLLTTMARVRQGWGVVREGRPETHFWNIPWVRQSSSKTATWQFDYEIDFTCRREGGR